MSDATFKLSRKVAADYTKHAGSDELCELEAEQCLADFLYRALMEPEKQFGSPSERAELQVSLLNEIGLTLTAVAKEQVAQAETLKTYKLSLEGIQGLLVQLEHSFDVIAEVQANSYDAVVTKFEAIYKRLTPMENRMADIQLSIDAMHGPKRGDVTGSIRGIDIHVKALAEGLANSNRWQSEHECLLAAVHAIVAKKAPPKPRKAGKRKRVKHEPF